MGKKHHTRVVINGSPVYNLGGATCKLLKEQAKDKNWHPMLSGDWPVVLGTGKFHPNEVHTVTLFFITRTPGRKRRLDSVYQYVYTYIPNGDIKHAVDRFCGAKISQMHGGKLVPLMFDPDDFTYRFAINFIDMTVKPDGDMLWKIRSVMPMTKPQESKPETLWEKTKSWFRRHFIDQ